MVIDVHTHAFSEAIAQRTMARLSGVVGRAPAYDGTVAGLKGAMAGAGIDHAVLLVVATKPSQHGTINAWAAEQNGGNISAFGSVHPDCDDPYAELTRIKALGLKGIKVHPDYQATESDDARYMPIYEAAQALGLICLFHCGQDSLSPHHVHNSPRRMRGILERFPRLKIIGGHMGGMRMWDEMEQELLGRDIYFDTSLVHQHLPAERIRSLLDRHDPDRLLFGSDAPWGEMRSSLDFILRLRLPGDREEKLLSGNARALLGV